MNLNSWIMLKHIRMSSPNSMMKRKEKRKRTDTQTPSFQYEEKFIFESNPGEYEFTLDLTYPSQSIIYVSRIDKLCIQFGKLIPFRFKFSNNIPTDCSIKIRVLYSYKESELCTRRSPAVTRCYNHQQEGSKGMHVITSPMSGSILSESAEDGSLSVSVPLSSMQREGDIFTALYTFSCFTSCFKDPLQIVLDLEDPGGVLLGQKSLGLRVCACPKRDSEVLSSPPTKKRRISVNPDLEADTYFRENAVGKKTYKFVWELNDKSMFQYLQTIKRGYNKDLKRYLRSLSPE